MAGGRPSGPPSWGGNPGWRRAARPRRGRARTHPPRGDPGGKGRTGTDRRERGRRRRPPRGGDTGPPRGAARSRTRLKGEELSTTDTSGPPTTKDAARCDNSREMRNTVNRRDFQRGRRPRGLPRGHARPSVARRTQPRAPRRDPGDAGGPGGRGARRPVIPPTRAPKRTAAPRSPDDGEARVSPSGRSGPDPREGADEPRPRIGRDHPANLSILITGGRETNRDVLGSGERSGRRPNRIPGPEGPGGCGGDATARGSSGSRSAWKGGDEEGDIPVRSPGAPAERARRRVGPLGSAARIG